MLKNMVSICIYYSRGSGQYTKNTFDMNRHYSFLLLKVMMYIHDGRVGYKITIM